MHTITLRTFKNQRGAYCGIMYTTDGQYIDTVTLSVASQLNGRRIDYALFRMFVQQLGIDRKTALLAALQS